jgi:hypothetical protein
VAAGQRFHEPAKAAIEAAEQQNELVDKGAERIQLIDTRRARRLW